MIPLPNFFIVGAPKAGTTALHACLGHHPEIYLSPIKEPNYFADEVRPEHLDDELLRDFELRQRELRAYLDGPMEKRFGGLVLDWDQYLKLFRNVRRQKAIGEASPIYLWSRTAPRNIAARLPQARIVMVLRDPADRAFSHYLHHCTAGAVRHTFAQHLAEALAASNRKMSRHYPFLEFGCYGEQLRRYLEYFPRERIHILFYEDFQSQARESVARLLRFLEVDPGVPVAAGERHNQPRVPRFRTAGYLLKRWGIWQRGRKLLPDRAARWLRPLALAGRQSLAMEPQDRAFLVSYYREDIADLSRLVDRDLSAWLRY